MQAICNNFSVSPASQDSVQLPYENMHGLCTMSINFEKYGFRRLLLVMYLAPVFVNGKCISDDSLRLSFALKKE